MCAFGAAFFASALLLFSWGTIARAQAPAAKARAASQAATPATEALRAIETPRPLELSRAVRPWEFLPALGTKAGFLGNEAGRMEAWVYPLKIFRDFHLKFHVEGRTIAADSLARTLITRPESSTIVYTGDTFSVRETFLFQCESQER